MARKHVVNRAAKDPLDRSATDRRAFLTGAGACGAMLLGAAYLPGSAAVASAQGAPPESDEFPVEEKTIVKLLGVVQRRPGLTRFQVKFRSPDFDFSAADRALMAGQQIAGGARRGANVAAEERRPTGTGQYFRWVYLDLTKSDPGRQTRQIHNVVADGAFGDGQTCTVLANRDLVLEFSYERADQTPPGRGAGAGAAAGGGGQAAGGRGDGAGAPGTRPEPTPPDLLDSKTALNMVVQQVIAQGTRPFGASGGEKVMHFLKLSATATGDQIQAWKRLHDRAVAATPAFPGSVQGYELMQRLPNTPAKESLRCGTGEIPVPELVSAFWFKKADNGAGWQNYVRAFRQGDAENVFDPAGCFFLVIQEYQYT